MLGLLNLIATGIFNSVTTNKAKNTATDMINARSTYLVVRHVITSIRVRLLIVSDISGRIVKWNLDRLRVFIRKILNNLFGKFIFYKMIIKVYLKDVNTRFTEKRHSVLV